MLGRGRLLSRTADGKPLRVIGAHTDISATKAAQAALLENEERLRTALDAARMATFERDIASARITWSPRHEGMWGYAPGEFDGTDAAFERRIHPDDLPRIRAAVQRGVADGKPTTDEFRVVWPDGSVRWMNSSGQVTFDETGRPRHIRGVVIDVTERRESEAALQRTKETLVEAQRIAHVGSFEFVAATRTTAWSEEEFRIYGLDPAGRSPDYEALLARHIHPDDAAQLHAVFSKAVETRSVYELEHRVVHPDGTVRWVFDRALPYFGADGTLVRYVGTTLDITNRKRAEESMRERERQFRSMVQSSPIATAFVRTDGRVEIVNRRFTELFGYEVHDIPTLADWFRQAYPDDAYRRKVIEGWQAATDPGAARPDGGPRERRVACKSGKVRIVEFTTIVMVDGVLVKMVDLTDRKQAEDALQEREALLAQAMTQADLAYWNFDAATGVLTLNDWFYALLGTSAEREGGYEMQVDRYAREFLPAEEQPSVAGELQRSGPEGGGAEWRIEHRIRRRDGAIRHVVVRAVQVREPDGRIAGTRGVVQDITDRKEMETTLRENEARLRLALGAAQAGMWEWDVGTNDNIWSAEVWALYGLDPQRWPDSYQAWMESIPPEDRATITRRVDAAAREGTEIEIEWRVNLPGNEPRWLLSLGRPEKDRAGRVVRYRGIVVNITARKQAEAKLAEQMAELRRWYAATVGRESRVLELKAEVNQLLRAAGKAPKYGSAEDSIAPPGRAQTPGRT